MVKHSFTLKLLNTFLGSSSLFVKDYTFIITDVDIFIVIVSPFLHRSLFQILN